MSKKFNVFQRGSNGKPESIGVVTVLNDIFTDEQSMIVLGKLVSSYSSFNGDWVKCEKGTGGELSYSLFDSNTNARKYTTITLKEKTFTNNIRNYFTVFGQSGFERLKIKSWDEDVKNVYGEISIKSWCSKESQEIAIIELKDMKTLHHLVDIPKDTICEKIGKEFDSIKSMTDGGRGSFNNAYILTKGENKYILRLTYCTEGKCWKSEMYGLLMQELLRSMDAGLKDGICKIYDFGTYSNTHSKKDQGAYAIMEYLPNSFDLPTVTKYDVVQKTEKFNQLLNILKIMHKNGYAHLDIKFDNVRMDDNNNVKLLDFGFAQFISKPLLVEHVLYTNDICLSDHFTIKGSIGFLDPTLTRFSHLCLNLDLYAVGRMIYYSFQTERDIVNKYVDIFKYVLRDSPIPDKDTDKMNLFKAIFVFNYREYTSESFQILTNYARQKDNIYTKMFEDYKNAIELFTTRSTYTGVVSRDVAKQNTAINLIKKYGDPYTITEPGKERPNPGNTEIGGKKTRYKSKRGFKKSRKQRRTKRRR